MSPQKQCIEIALTLKYSITFDDVFYTILSPSGKKLYGSNVFTNLSLGCPSYTRDLNAIHDAENEIGLHGDDFKGRKLRRIWEKHISSVDPRFATAPQRCEAFLKTVGRWEP